MSDINVLILQNELSSYNVCTYNEIAKKCNLTIGYYDRDKSEREFAFEKKHLDSYTVGPFVIIKGLYRFVKQFDAVCVVPDPHVISYCILPFYRHKFKTLSWSIGFRCSYIHPYITSRKHDFIDRLYQCLFQHFDANIFYMEKSKEFWKGTSLDMSKVFVAPNTTEVVPIDFLPEQKKNILFVGTLYKGKGIDLLINSFKEAINKSSVKSKLVIVGGGEMKEELQQFVKENDLSESVEFTGPIYDEEKLGLQFQKALLCVSPTQGGLTCPKSMGYGVPFVCRKDAITGGEIYHMTSGENGIMYDRDEGLTDILVDAITNPAKYVEMGIKAKEYYDNNATIKHMAQGAIDAINYTLNK